MTELYTQVTALHEVYMQSLKANLKLSTVMENPYSKREIDDKMDTLHTKLDAILVQTTKHNGRLTKVERILLVVGCISGTILILNGKELIKFIMAII